MKNLNADLGSNLGSPTEMDDLIARVRSFAPQAASPTEDMALVKALSVIAADVIQRHEKVSKLQQELAEKIAVASVASELAGVLAALGPEPVTQTGRKWWFGR